MEAVWQLLLSRDLVAAQVFGFSTHSQTFIFLQRKCFSTHLTWGGGLELIQSSHVRLQAASWFSLDV